MHIDGLENIKKYFNASHGRYAEKGYMTFHKMKDGTPFVINISGYEIEAVCFRKNMIDRLCLGLFSIKQDAYGYKFIHLSSIKSSKAGLGVGSEIINALKHHGIKNNCKYIYLASTKGAEEFYDKIGFKCENYASGGLKHYSFDLQKIAKIPITKELTRIEV